MSKIFLLLAAACLAGSIIAQNTCMDQCGFGCFVDTEAQKCKSCPTGCVNCTDSNTCTLCAPGYYLAENKTCVECNVTGCANCTKDGECTACHHGFFLENSSSCAFCGTLCDVCASASECKTCMSSPGLGIYHDASDGTCNYCPDGCASCNSTGVCTECSSGYVLNGTQCVSCSTIDVPCIACDVNLTTCIACDIGHYLMNNTCLECAPGCINCTDDTKCEKCSSGYFLNSTQGCDPCINSCRECETSFGCSACYLGFEYDSKKGECVDCNLDCTGFFYY